MRAASGNSGFTLVEMLIAVSITLVMMATVVGIFATVSESVSNRRAVVEIGGQIRHVRNVLQRDLEGITCPALPWQKPESNQGYFEIIEGLHADFYPSMLTDGIDSRPSAQNNLEIDHPQSTLPASNLPFTSVAGQAGWVTDGGALGDYDDILAFTTRNESEPFTGLAPTNNLDLSNNQPMPFGNWRSQTIKSPVAEVVWYAVENPVADTGGYFGNESQQGFRTVYRRVLLVAPWIDYRYNIAGSGAKSRPGVLRVLGDGIDQDEVQQALASLIAFQERYDISSRIEFDPTMGADGRWTVVANTLSDLTKRENRYEHHGFVGDNNSGQRNFPYVMVSAGGAPTTNPTFVVDPEYDPNGGMNATAIPRTEGDVVSHYDVTNQGSNYFVRPLVILEGGATARALIEGEGIDRKVIHVTTGLVPLGWTSTTSSRRGQDLMLSDALGFDIQVFDPQAPSYALRPNVVPLRTGDSELSPSNANDLANLDLTTVGPSSIGWLTGATDTNDPVVVSEGSYVDLGYRELHREVFRRIQGSTLAALPVDSPFAPLANGKSQLLDGRLTRVYDTWSFHYENDGLDQDGDGLFDEGTNGFDDPAVYPDTTATRLGIDDPAERETSPPYPEPLRAVQVKLRVYEADSKQMREVTVRQHFVPE